MMMMRFMTAFVLVAAVAVPTSGQTTGTTNMEILRDKLKADKKLIVAENLTLTDTESAAFWPVYDAYQKDLQQINQRMATMIESYAEAYNKGPVSNETAKKLLDESQAIEDAEATLKRSAIPKVLAVLPAAKAARYIQMENKIRALVRYELAANIPLVD
jgi:hypothetical protein